jgi:hypothetical protein
MIRAGAIATIIVAVTSEGAERDASRSARSVTATNWPGSQTEARR